MSLIKSASTVSLLTLASRVTGLVRDTLFASVFGVNAMTDAFNVAFRIPNMFRRVLGEGAFSQAFVPALAACKSEQGVQGARALIDHTATLLTWVLVLLCIVGVVGAPLLVWVGASGLRQTPHAFDEATLMTRMMFPYIGCMSLVALAGGILNTWRQFAVPAVSPVLLNVSLIGSIVLGVPLFKRWGIEPIYAQCVGVMLGGFLQLTVQLPALKRLDLMPHIGMTWSTIQTAWAHGPTRNVVRKMLPALLGVSVAQVSLLINMQIATHLRVGSLSWLSNSDRLMEFPTGLLGVALGVVLMPQLTSARATSDVARYSSLLDWGLRIVVLMSVPSALGLLLFAKPLVAVLYHYGAFTDFDAQQTAYSLMGWGAGLVGIVAIKVLASGYYANQDMKTPVRIAIVVLILTQLMNLLFVPTLKHAGLSLSIGLGAMLNAVWLLIGLVRQGSYVPEAGWGRFFLQVMAGSLLLAAYLVWAEQAVPWLALKAHSLTRIGLMAAVLIGSGGVYLGTVWAAGLNLRQFLRR